MFGLGPIEMLIVGVIAVLLFGNRLPEVGRSVGRSLMEFKKGMRDIQNDVDTGVNQPSHSQISRASAARPMDDHDEPTAPKFEPPAREPSEAAAAHAPSDAAV
jgi:sec-independent protein translocase protein TatA